MNESKILRTACDAKWYAHAYSEYLADVAQTTSNLMAAIQQALSMDELTEASAKEVLTNHGIDPAARFIIGEYGSKTALYLITDSWSRLQNTEEYTSASGYSIEEAFSTIRGSWTQCVISSKAFESYSSDAKDSISRVSKFIQDIQANFPLDDTVRDTVAYYQAMINAAPQVTDFVNQFINATGVNGADESDDPMAYINSDVYKYTGNTPGIALDFSTANKAVSSTVSIAAKAVKGVFSIIGKGASWLFGKVKKYVVDTVIDPAVCEYIGNDDNNEGYIDGFAWYGEFIPSLNYSLFDNGGQISDVFSGFYDEYATKWIKIKLKIGEFLFRIVDQSNKWQCYFKPVAVDIDYIQENFTGSTLEPPLIKSQLEKSLSDYNEWLFSVMEHVQPLPKDATKEQIYRGLAFSTNLMSSVALFAFVETYYNVTGFDNLNLAANSSTFTDLTDYYTFSPLLEEDAVNNKKILLAASGDPSNLNNIQYYLDWSDTMGARLYNTVPRFAMQTIMTNIIAIWALCRKERNSYPIDYTFVPYSNNHTSFSPSSWRIKSDIEIAETRDNFIENAILAVVVVAAVVFIGVTVRKISKNAFFKRQEAIGRLENKMWSGQALTNSERKKYIRYNRKQNASKWLTSGMSEPTTTLSNDSQLLIALIRG